MSTDLVDEVVFNLPVPRKAISENATRADYVSRILEYWATAVEAVFMTGIWLRAAKQALPHGEFTAMVETDLPFGIRAAQMMMTVAEDDRLQTRTIRSLLPPHWKTIYQISRLDDDQLQAWVKAGKIHPEMTERDVVVHHAKVKREDKHAQINAKAQTAQFGGVEKAFPLIYADPPWKFDTLGERGIVSAPDAHYPTLPYEEIKNLTVGEHKCPVPRVAADDAALFLWCTSSNMHLALEVMVAWGFDYKTHAVWIKDKIGLGYIFRNQHELLLYGTRGNMPAPEFKPPSVFKYPRGKHSAKPPQIRKTIEKMFPAYGPMARLEIFARGKIRGWQVYGLEADVNAAS